MERQTAPTTPHVALLNNLVEVRLAELASHTLDILLIPAMIALCRGNLIEAGAWAIIPTAMCLGRWVVRRRTRNVYAELGADHFSHGDTRVSLGAIQSVRWFADQQPRAAVTYRDTTGSRRIKLLFKPLAAADQLILIRYLRRLSFAVEQIDWPNFCRVVATPLAKRLAAEQPAQEERGRRSLVEWCLEYHRQIDPTQPRWRDYLVLPATLLGVFGVVSRRTYWLLAGLLAASACINVRLFWGAWFSPFTEILLGFAAVLGLLSLFAPRAGKQTRDAMSFGLQVVFWFALGIIGVPLGLNLVVAGVLPNWVGQFGIHVLFVVIHMPILVMVIRQRRANRKNRAHEEVAALAYWRQLEAGLSTARAPERGAG